MLFICLTSVLFYSPLGQRILVNELGCRAWVKRLILNMGSDTSDLYYNCCVVSTKTSISDLILKNKTDICYNSYHEKRCSRFHSRLRLPKRTLILEQNKTRKTYDTETVKLYT